MLDTNTTAGITIEERRWKLARRFTLKCFYRSIIWRKKLSGPIEIHIHQNWDHRNFERHTNSVVKPIFDTLGELNIPSGGENIRAFLGTIRFEILPMRFETDVYSFKAKNEQQIGILLSWGADWWPGLATVTSDCPFRHLKACIECISIFAFISFSSCTSGNWLIM